MIHRHIKEREGVGMTGRRLGYGFLTLVAAAIVLVIGYKTAPRANACHTINSINVRAGRPPECLPTPSTGYLVTAGILAAIGLLFAAPWWLKWFSGK
jgi:hypothetical protein